MTNVINTEMPVVIERNGGVAVVTINRPARRNSLTTRIKTALSDGLIEVASDPSVRAVVLTGAGGHFSAGQDLSEHAEVLAKNPEHAFDTVGEHYSPIVTTLATMPKPVVAAIEGNCVGAGLGLALASDLRVVSRNAVLATAFSSIGLTCDSGLAHTLPRAVGEAKARELVLLAEPLTADAADRLGLVTRLVDPGRAAEVAMSLATSLAAGPTCAYAESKLLLASSFMCTLDQTLTAEGRAQARAGATKDHATAVSAFLAKEKPAFVGA